MSAAFEKNSFDWQVQQIFRRAGEWVERVFVAPNLPNLPNAPQWWFPENLLETAFWTIVIFASIWLGWRIWRLFTYLNVLNPDKARWLNRPAKGDEERDRTVAAWMRQMQEFQRQGNYSEACRALYMAMLQRLNDTKLLPHQSSRTDGEYLQVVQQLPQAQSYQTLISTHEQLCFGQATISSEEFSTCQRAYQEIEQGSEGQIR
ncbi:DUF4129 domain-containing protein [Phormidesmis sp. 146-12]